MLSELKILLKSKLVSANFFLGEWLWKLRLSIIIFLIGKKNNLGKALNGLKTKGYYVFDNYYSNQEVEKKV